MSAEPEFRVDGPHSPELTRAAADRAAELIRFCNYATMAGSGGLRYPADAYELVASLYILTQRMPQLCDQIGLFLDAQHETGRLADNRGRDPLAVTGTAFAALLDAREAAGNLTEVLRAVQNAIAGLYVLEDDHG